MYMRGDLSQDDLPKRKIIASTPLGSEHKTVWLAGVSSWPRAFDALSWRNFTVFWGRIGGTPYKG